MFPQTYLINFYWFVFSLIFIRSLFFPDSIIGIRIKTGSDKLHTNENVLPLNELLATKSQQQISPPQSSLSSSNPPPTITITTSEDDEPIDGMLDRISHDLDYLLNRTIQVPVVVRRTVPNKQIDQPLTSLEQSALNQSGFLSMTPAAATTASGGTSTFSSVHEVILEEAEE